MAFAEVMHTALAFFQAGRGDDGFNLLKGSILDGMYLGKSPGNFGQIVCMMLFAGKLTVILQTK